MLLLLLLMMMMSVWCCARSSRILSMGELQRVMSTPRWGGVDEDSALWTHQIRTLHARGPWQCRLCCWRTCSSRQKVFWSTQLPHDDSWCYSTRHSSVSQGTHALSRGQLHLRQG